MYNFLLSSGLCLLIANFTVGEGIAPSRGRISSLADYTAGVELSSHTAIDAPRLKETCQLRVVPNNIIVILHVFVKYFLTIPCEKVKILL